MYKFEADQHGTVAIALEIVKKSIKKVRMVVNGAGAAGLSCVSLLKAMGLPDDNVVMLDRELKVVQRMLLIQNELYRR